MDTVGRIENLDSKNRIKEAPINDRVARTMIADLMDQVKTLTDLVDGINYHAGLEIKRVNKRIVALEAHTQAPVTVADPIEKYRDQYRICKPEKGMTVGIREKD